MRKAAHKRKKAVARDPNEELGYVLENAADAVARRLYIQGEIDEALAAKFVIGLQKLDATDGDIVVLLNTVGGLCNDGLAIYDAIRFARNPVMVVGTGAVMSMGSVILQAADLRLLSPNVEFMIHNISLDPGHQKVHELRVTYRSTENLNERLLDILTERSRQPRERVRQWMLEETYLTAEQAVVNGFADEVMKPAKKKEIGWKRT